MEVQYFPPIELDSRENYMIGLVEFFTWNSIPNIDETNNEFNIVNKGLIQVPTGSYELDDIPKILIDESNKKGVTLDIKVNKNTLRTEVKCSHDLDFGWLNSIGQVFGFKQQVLKRNRRHLSDNPAVISKVNALRVECNIATGSYINDKKVHTIHQFVPTVPPGYKIIEVPSNIIYSPVGVHTISDIQLQIVDQLGNFIDFRGEPITVRLHIKSV
uniref:Uncharacterized protein n=1 Tax=Bracon brevicornis TaxID=1563983 RepID=A0A6V7KD48_9HYME